MTSKTETPDIVEMLAETSEACAEDCNTGIAAVMKMAAAEIERLRSELAKHQWRTMESAPLDGRHVMLGMADEQYVAEGYYEQDGPRGWFATNTHWSEDRPLELYPTHWQPLPSPPGEKDGGSTDGGFIEQS